MEAQINDGKTFLMRKTMFCGENPAGRPSNVTVDVQCLRAVKSSICFHKPSHAVFSAIELKKLKTYFVFFEALFFS